MPIITALIDTIPIKLKIIASALGYSLKLEPVQFEQVSRQMQQQHENGNSNRHNIKGISISKLYTTISPIYYLF